LFKNKDFAIVEVCPKNYLQLPKIVKIKVILNVFC